MEIDIQNYTFVIMNKGKKMTGLILAIALTSCTLTNPDDGYDYSKECELIGINKGRTKYCRNYNDGSSYVCGTTSSKEYSCPDGIIYTIAD